jgi:pilus assembly protein CpaB
MALPQIPKEKLFLIVGLILGIVAIFMVKTYVDQERAAERQKAKKALADIQAKQTAVLVAKKDIPRGVSIESEILEVAIVPNQYLQPQAVTSLHRIAGMVTLAPISKGEQISLSKLAFSQQGAAAGTLAAATPVGKRAITISVDNIAALSGMIRPGDFVDVIALVSMPQQTAQAKQVTQSTVMPLFQNVLILAVGQDRGAFQEADARYKKEEKKEISPLITLALNPEEASLIAFVQEQGKIRLVLRSPEDSQIEPVQSANWDSLFQYLMSKGIVKPEAKEEPKAVESVEIYRGLNKERIPLSK